MQKVLAQIRIILGTLIGHFGKSRGAKITSPFLEIAFNSSFATLLTMQGCRRVRRRGLAKAGRTQTHTVPYSIFFFDTATFYGLI